MITLQDISVRYGGFELFNKISLSIADKERVGLVGRNGAGKSTLLKLITGIEIPEKGKINVPNGLIIGYLPQKMVFKTNKSVLEEAFTAFDEVILLEKKIARLNEELNSRNDFDTKEYSRLISQQSEASERFEFLGGTNAYGETEQVLMGLGFNRENLTEPCSNLSGGWRMRIEIAKLLLKKPHILLLDEPTNHLDIESIIWLEEFLQNYSGSLVLISHDRIFLDAVTKRTVEIYLGQLHDYKVPYSKFVKLRKERKEQLLAAYRNQQRLIEKTEEFIERFRYKATKANQVQSRIKQLEKLELIEIEGSEGDIHFRFPPPPRSGDIVCEVSHLSKNFDSGKVLNDVSFILERGEKVAFVGRNGEGKTTMARILVNELEYTGNFRLGHNVSIGYYAQNQDELLDETKSVLETIDDAATGDIRTRIRGLLGSFLFGKDEVDKKVKILSGGERSRLSLIKLLLKPVSLLILDEPTNHLDLRSKDILKNALVDYSGTLIVVSHDRYFLDGLVSKVYEFKAHKIKEYMGGIQEFLEKRKLSSLNELEKNIQLQKKRSHNEGAKSNKQQYLDRKNQQKELRKLSNELFRKEEEIEDIENKIKDLDKILENPESISGSESNDEFFTSYKKLKHKQEQLLYEWEIISGKVEGLMSLIFN